jgi:hypothetical protein
VNDLHAKASQHRANQPPIAMPTDQHVDVGRLRRLHDLRFYPEHRHQSEPFVPESSYHDPSSSKRSKMIAAMHIPSRCPKCHL